MNEKWKKLGLIFEVKGQRSWMMTHAQQPVVDYLEDDLFRVYFATRNSKGQPQGAFFDISLNDPTKITNLSSEPFLEIDDKGFDRDGVYPSSLLNIGDEKFMYYAGRFDYQSSFSVVISLAISSDGGRRYNKYAGNPIMERSQYDPWMVSTPWIYTLGSEFRMIYISGLFHKTNSQGKAESTYNLKYATSNNGIDWKREGEVAIDFVHEGESNICRPSVLYENGLYKMWFSYAGTGSGLLYKPGYAESSDGVKWTRKDSEVGISNSPGTFDSDMICYPCVISHRGKKYMFYNGNNNGRDGIGLAVWDDIDVL